jgi:uncharacterized membrane protein
VGGAEVGRDEAVMTDLAQASSDVRGLAPTARRETSSRTRPTAAAVAVMAAVGAAWTAAIGTLAIWRHDQFLSHRFDLGNMVQAVWSSAHGRPLQVTDGLTGEQVTRFAGHIDPALLLFVPFWWVHSAPETLLLLQAAALASGLYPVVRLALKHLESSATAALLGAWYLAFPWMVWNAVNDIHPVTLAIPLLLYAIWWLDEDRLALFALFAGLAMLTGELIGLTVAGLGLWYAVSRRRWTIGGTIAGAGIIWTVVCLLLLIPAFNDGGGSPFYGRFEAVGGSPTGVFRTLLADPGVIVNAVSERTDLLYVVLVLLPTAGLALGTPLLLLAALPQLFVNTLSEFPSTTDPAYQYVAPAIAPVVVASIIGLGRLPRRLHPYAAATALAVAVASLAAMPPAPGSDRNVFGERETAGRLAAMRHAVTLVPAGVPVVTTNRLGAHLSERRVIHLFPASSSASWAVLDTRDPWLVASGERLDAPRFAVLLERFQRDPGWRLVYEQSGVHVYRRVS